MLDPSSERTGDFVEVKSDVVGFGVPRKSGVEVRSAEERVEEVDAIEVVAIGAATGVRVAGVDVRNAARASKRNGDKRGIVDDNMVGNWDDDEES